MIKIYSYSDIKTANYTNADKTHTLHNPNASLTLGIACTDGTDSNTVMSLEISFDSKTWFREQTFRVNKGQTTSLPLEKSLLGIQGLRLVPVGDKVLTLTVCEAYYPL